LYTVFEKRENYLEIMRKKVLFVATVFTKSLRMHSTMLSSNQFTTMIHLTLLLYCPSNQFTTMIHWPCYCTVLVISLLQWFTDPAIVLSILMLIVCGLFEEWMRICVCVVHKYILPCRNLIINRMSVWVPLTFLTLPHFLPCSMIWGWEVIVL
jgi:hypothetical protein